MPSTTAISERTSARKTKRSKAAVDAGERAFAGPATSSRDTVYVYLDSGQVAVVRNVSSMEMSDRTIRLLRNGMTIAEYRRSDVYCATRELISPPFAC